MQWMRNWLHLCERLYLSIYMYTCLVSLTLCFSLCVCVCDAQCLCGRAVSFGLVVSIIRSRFYPVSFSLFLSKPPPLSSSYAVLTRSTFLSLSLFLHLPFACICAAEWWVLNHRFILCAMMNEGKSVHFSLFILHSISVPICLFIHPTMYPSLSV